MANVDYTITGNSQDAAAEVEKLRAKFERLELQLRASATAQKGRSREAKSALDVEIQGLQNLAMNVISVQAAWAAATKAVQLFHDAQKKVHDQRNQIAPSERETEIKLKNQGLLSDQETKRTIESAQKESLRIPVDSVHNSKRAMEEMFSQGFDRGEVISGEALRAFLELRAATNQFGEGSIDPKELVKSLATSLRNTEGRDPTAPIKAAELRDFGEAFQSLFLTQSIQLPDAIPFARIQSILTQRGIDRETQLAAFTVAVDSFGSGDVAATYLQQATAYMGRSGTQAMKKKLKKRGMEVDTSGFDLVGEDLVQALANLNTMFSNMPQDQRIEVADALFGTKAQAGVMTLMGKSENIATSRQRIQQALAGGQNYDQAVLDYVGSDYATQKTAENRLAIETARGVQEQGGLTFDDVLKVWDKVGQKISTEGTVMERADYIIQGITGDLRYRLGGSSMTPKEYFENLASPMGVGSIKNSTMLNNEFNRTFDAEQRRRTLEMDMKFQDGAVEGGAQVPLVLPENMEVNDPEAVGALNELNNTMGQVRDLLQGSIVDQSGMVKVPRGGMVS